MRSAAGHVAKLAVLILAIAGAGLAHDGPHAARVIADVLSAKQDGRDVAVTLRIEALDGPVQLLDMWVSMAETVSWTGSSSFDPETPRTLEAMLRFDRPVPELFTLTLDFGEGGLSPVLVIPN